MPLLTLLCFVIAFAAIGAVMRQPRSAWLKVFWLLALLSLAGFLVLVALQQ